MRGLVIAAGSGIRMRPYTHERPKCMLPINGRPLIAYTLEALRGAGCTDITIITGYLKDQIDAPGCYFVHNTNYENNNILHSLMYARDFLDDDVMVTYSDILVNPDVHKRLVTTPGDIVTAVDVDWRPYYEGRTNHPVSEAEKAFVEISEGQLVAKPLNPLVLIDNAATPKAQVKTMGKYLNPTDAGPYLCGEFVGLWKMSAAGARRFYAHFEALDMRLSPLTPFRSAKEWRKAYVTDFLTDMIAGGTRVDCLLIERSWAEFDTAQDYERFPAIARRQRLFSLETAS